MIQTAGEMGIALAGERAEITKRKFNDAVRPVFMTERNRLMHCGTCVLIRVSGHSFLITAAHVMDAARSNGPLFVGGATTPTELYGKYIATKSIVPRRSDDRYDFAVLRLSNAQITELGQVEYIAEEDISTGQNSSGHVYSIIGYPHSKNKNMDRVNKVINSARWHYFAQSVENPELIKRLAVTGEDHILVAYGKRARDAENKQIISSVSTLGVSGGGVFDLGNLGDPNEYAPATLFKPQLAALFIEYYASHKTTVATKMSAILQATRQSYGL